MTNYDSYYDYKTLREKALAESATSADRINLCNWLGNYAICDWNGECYDIGDGLSLYPIYKEIDEDVFELVDCYIK